MPMTIHITTCIITLIIYISKYFEKTKKETTSSSGYFLNPNNSPPLKAEAGQETAG